MDGVIYAMETDWTAIATVVGVALPPTIAAVAALVVAIRTHTIVNSRMDEIKRSIAKESYAQGREDERIDQDATDREGKED